MKTCPQCQTGYDDSKKFCTTCGVPLAAAQAAFSPEVTAKRQIFEGRLAAEGPNPALLGEYGDYLASQGLSQEALVQYLAAANLEPGDRALRLKVVEAYKGLGQFDQAAVQLLLMIESAPQDLALKEALASVYLASGRKPEAAKVLAQMSELDPGNADLLRLRRDLLLELGQGPELTQVCATVVGLTPSDADTWSLLAQLRYQAGQLVEAREAAESALRAQPGQTKANLYLGLALHDLGQETQRAQSAVAAALESGQGLAAQEQAVARVYQASLWLKGGGDPASALEGLRAAPARDLPPNALELYVFCFLQVGDAYYGQGQEDAAIAAWQSCLERVDNPGARERLAGIFAARGQTLAAGKQHGPATEAFTQSLRYLPQQPEVEAALRRSRKAVRGKRTMLASIIAGVVLLLAGGSGYYYYGQSSWDIEVTPPAVISLLKDQEVVVATQSEQRNLKSGMLRSGSYTLRVEKEGYEKEERALKVPMGRENLTARLTLKPRQGDIRIGSAPTGAQISLSNRYDKKSARTPAVIKNVFAVPTKVEVSMPGFLPYRAEVTPTPGQELDLGQIAFTGTLQLDSEPSGAEALVGGVSRGTTPITIEALPAKPVEVELNKKGGGSYIGTVDVLPHQVTKAGPFKLAQLGTVKVDSNPSGAKLWLDGTESGQTPRLFKGVAAGPHTAKLEAPNCLPLEHKFVVESGQVNDLGALAITQCTTIKVGSNPAGARVILDGRPVGVTPMEIKGVTTGKHTVSLEMIGHAPLSKDVSLELGSRADLGVLALTKRVQRAGLLVNSTANLDPDEASIKAMLTETGVKFDVADAQSIKSGAVEAENFNLIYMRTGSEPRGFNDPAVIRKLRAAMEDEGATMVLEFHGVHLAKYLGLADVDMRNWDPGIMSKFYFVQPITNHPYLNNLAVWSPPFRPDEAGQLLTAQPSRASVNYPVLRWRQPVTELKAWRLKAAYGASDVPTNSEYCQKTPGLCVKDRGVISDTAMEYVSLGKGKVFWLNSGHLDRLPHNRMEVGPAAQRLRQNVVRAASGMALAAPLPKVEIKLDPRMWDPKAPFPGNRVEAALATWPHKSGPVRDRGSLINMDHVMRITMIATELLHKTGIAMVLATSMNMPGDVSDAARVAFDEMGMGQGALDKWLGFFVERKPNAVDWNRYSVRWKLPDEYKNRFTRAFDNHYKNRRDTSLAIYQAFRETAQEAASKANVTLLSLSADGGR